MSSPSLHAQIILTHDAPITELRLDTNEILLVTDAEGIVYRQGRYKLEKSENKHKGLNLNGYQIKDNQLIHQKGDIYSKIPLDFTPQAMTMLGSRPLIASDNNLWILENGNAKHYYVPGQNFPNAIRDLTTQGSLITMIAGDYSMHVYDTLHQLLTYIDEKVSDAVMDKWQCLWYSEGKRLYQDNRFVSDKPPLLMDLSIVDKAARPLDTSVVIKDNVEDYSISYAGKYSPSYHDLRYAYRYDNEDWVLLGNTTSFPLSNLGPGKHTVYVKAMGLEGIDSSVIRSLSFEIAGKDYADLIKWGIGLLLGLLGLSLLGGVRTRAQMKSLAAEKEKIQWQLELANEKQKLGQAQMNPHFLFNALNGISGLIATNELSTARSALQFFSKIMRTVLEGSREQQITLADEITFLTSYLKLEQIIQPFEFDFDITSSLPDQTLVPPMIIQPFIENAVIHGVSGLQRKGKIEVTIKGNGQYAEATIIDNGKGRQQASIQSKSTHKSAAINIVEERLNLLDKWSSQAHINYTDLVDADQQSAGTKVTLLIPKL